MSGSILVPGGAGFIGSHIVEILARTAEPKIIAYDVNAVEKSVGKVVNVRGDVFDSDKLLAAMRKEEVSKVVHMVGLASIPDCRKNPERSFRLNVSSVHNVLEAMRLSDTERLVFSSTAVVYGAVNNPTVSEEVEPKPVSVYGCHKLAAESLIRGYAQSYGFKTTILRIFNVYGDLEMEHGVVSSFIKRSLSGKPLVVEGGEQVRDFVYLDDVIKAFTMSLDNAMAYNKVINVGSGVGLSVREVASMVKQSFPKVEVRYESPRKEEYSLFADASRMKTILALNPTDPKKGIPAFIKKYARES